MKFKEKLACILAVLMVASSSPLNTGNISVYAAETSVSSSASASGGKEESFPSKVWNFIKRHKGKIIAGAALLGVGFGAYKLYQHFHSSKNESPVDGEKLVKNGPEKFEGNGSKVFDMSKEEEDKLKEKLYREYREGIHPKDQKPETDANNAVIDRVNGVKKTTLGYGLFFGVALGGLVFNNVSSFFKSSRNFVKDADYVLNPYGPLGDVYRWVKRKFNNIFYPVKPISPGSSMENLELMYKELEGQEKAKKQLRTYINEIVTNKDAASKENKPYGHGDVLYFIGPSGVGKSFAAKGLADYKVLGNDGYYLMSSSDIDVKAKDRVPLLQQMFGFKYVNHGNREDANKQTNLYQYIQDNPNGIVIIDEYDKIFDESLDNVMWGIIDKGKVSLGSADLDCSGITFVLTSNESKASLGVSNDEEYNASLTHRKHEQALLNRVKVVEFEDLPLETYKDIARSQVIPRLKSYFSNEECGGINDVIADEEMIEAIAKKTVSYGRGARYMISDLHSGASTAIRNLIAGQDSEDFKNAKGKDVILKYVLEDIEESEKRDAKNDVDGKEYKVINGTYKYILDNIEPEERVLAKRDINHKLYVKVDDDYKKYRLLDLTPEEEEIAKEHINSRKKEKLYVRLQGYKKRIVEDLTPEEKELISKDENYVLQKEGLYVKIDGEYKKYKLLDISSDELKRAKRDKSGLYVKVGDTYKKYDLENITSDEEYDINFEEENNIYVKTDVYKKYAVQEIDPKEEILARKDTGNELYVINNPVYKKYVFKAEFKK